MKVKLRSEPTAEYQKVALEIDFEVKGKNEKEQTANLKILQQKVNDLAMAMLDDLLDKKTTYDEERAWIEPVEEKPAKAEVISPTLKKPQTGAPKQANIGALWLQEDGSLKGLLNNKRIVINDKQLEANIKAIVEPAFMEAPIKGVPSRVINNKYKSLPKHPDYVIYAIIGDEN